MPARRTWPTTHIAVADHLRRLLERVLYAVPEDERLTRHAEICNALLAWLSEEQRSDSVESGDALVVPVSACPPNDEYPRRREVEFVRGADDMAEG